VNWYGVIAQRHWARWLPRQYAAIGDPDSFFTALGEEAARQIDDLTDELAGETEPGDSYLARVGQLVAARALAEELLLLQRVRNLSTSPGHRWPAFTEWRLLSPGVG
jgi:hypothetical protein